MAIKMKEIAAFFKSFKFAFSGVLHVVLNERNMRFHTALCAYMYSFLLFFDFFAMNRFRYSLLLLATGSVLALECVNTAIERVVDLIGKQSALARAAKDSAAAAVLVMSIAAVLVGIGVMYQPAAFAKMFVYYKNNLAMLVLLLLSLIPSGCFIFIPPQKYLGNH